MAIATLQGHTQRAIDFFNKAGKYFVLGGTEPWNPDDASPDKPTGTEYKLRDIIGFKRVDRCFLVVEVTDQEIAQYGYTDIVNYRTQKWRRVDLPIRTTVKSTAVSAGDTIITVSSLEGMNVGNKVRVADTYEGIIVGKNETTNQITLNTPATTTVGVGAVIETGALVEGAKYVYVECYLDYDQFPVDVSYRQIGLCSEVAPDKNVLRAAKYNGGVNEYTSTGVLEVIDNRAPSTRDIDQREQLSLILEY